MGRIKASKVKQREFAVLDIIARWIKRYRIPPSEAELLEEMHQLFPDVAYKTQIRRVLSSLRQQGLVEPIPARAHRHILTTEAGQRIVEMRARQAEREFVKQTREG